MVAEAKCGKCGRSYDIEYDPTKMTPSEAERIAARKLDTHQQFCLTREEYLRKAEREGRYRRPGSDY